MHFRIHEKQNKIKYIATSANQNLTKTAGSVLKQLINHSYKFEPGRITERVDIGFELRRRRSIGQCIQSVFRVCRKIRYSPEVSYQNTCENSYCVIVTDTADLEVANQQTRTA